MYPTAYLDYLIYFHVDRDYFECHEILEEHWKKQPATNRQPHWVGLIQIAVGLYHHRRGNMIGAIRMYNKALQTVSLQANALSHLGLDVDELILLLNKQIKLAETPEEPFVDLNLPLDDSTLLALCVDRSEQLEKKWIFTASPYIDKALIHKHRDRNREDVINERLHQLQLKLKKRQ
ncbi:DUF309 domain-containing protein [Halalkalibacter alkalisediminis]|uniref:DUF309 domain-containing protein n=1 Tax=Halalkalibacter alkalisediminis TaxID=935616 RepID=A0ABV6NG89_9BACI|nr:DUF309 domain-containing protein [Halalkalibacter alkalisediminis]